MIRFCECWTSVATTLFAQALAGEPTLKECPLMPVPEGAILFSAKISGEQHGLFSIALDPAIFASPLVGEGVDQKSGWDGLLREVSEAAASEVLSKTGQECHVAQFEQSDSLFSPSSTFALRSAAGTWSIFIGDAVDCTETAADLNDKDAGGPKPDAVISAGQIQKTGIELLLDVELEATLRFGCREMPLAEILELGPGDVVELDRHVSDPVDLLVGDKIVARGEVVLVNGSFGLQVTEVAEPRKRLESVRCLF